jgi:hypothetical protein
MIRAVLVAALLAVYVAGANDPEFTHRGGMVSVLAGAHARLGARAPGSDGRGPTPEDRKVLEAAFAPGELVALEALVVAGLLVLTDRRLFLLRQGATHRPRTGVVSWPIDRALWLRFGPPKGGARRLAIEREGVTASVFVGDGSFPEVAALVGEVRARALGAGRG